MRPALDTKAEQSCSVSPSRWLWQPLLDEGIAGNVIWAAFILTVFDGSFTSGLTLGRKLLVFLQKRTSSRPVDMS